MRPGLLITRADGGVRVVTPSMRCVVVLMHGGGTPNLMGRDYEIGKLIADPHWHPWRQDRERFAAQWIDGLYQGGLTERDALMLIGEISCPKGGTALEIIDLEDLPPRTYRNAWRRSANGGPIYLDEDHATRLDEARLWAQYEDAA